LSQQELETDKYELIQFVIDDNNTKKGKLEHEQDKISLRAGKDEEVKLLDSQITQVKLEILKNAEKLSNAIRFKEFLLGLDREFADAQEYERACATEMLKSQWINKTKNLAPHDPQYKIVFTDDEEIHGEVKLIINGPGIGEK